MINQFFAHNLSGKHFTPRHVGWFGISVQKYIDQTQLLNNNNTNILFS